MFQIDSIHELPRLQSDLMLHGDMRLQKSSIDMSRDPLCNSVEVAMDNRQSNSKGKSKALGGNGKSKSKDRIENKCNVSEISVAGDPGVQTKK